MRMRYILLVALATAAIVALTARLTRPTEPAYEGKRLSAWVLDYQHVSPTGDAQPTDRAVRQIGTNAIPFLLRWLQYEPPLWREKLGKVYPEFLRRIYDPDRVTSGDLLAAHSARAFAALGTNAVTAMPALVQVMYNTNAPGAAYNAMRCLSRLGTNGLPPLLSVIQDPHYGSFREQAIIAVMTFHENPPPSSVVPPAFLKFVADPSAQLSAKALAAVLLSSIRYAPDVAVPAISAILTNPTASADDRRLAALALAGYGASAASTLPTLTNALTDPSSLVSDWASTAIEQITSELATNAPAQ